MARRPRSQSITLVRDSEGNYSVPGGASSGDKDLTDRLNSFNPLRHAAAVVEGNETFVGKRPPINVTELGIKAAKQVTRVARGAGRGLVASERFLESGLSGFTGLINYDSIRPPVPGSVGKWVGKGTKRDPYRWVGIPERLAGYGLLAALLIWGFETIEMDISNWWPSSALNIGSDFSNFDAWVAQMLGFKGVVPVGGSGSNSGKVASLGARQGATFWSWLFNQIMLQGQDIESAVTAVNGLALAGLSTGPPGSSSLPPGAGQGTYGGPSPGQPGNSAPGPGTISYYVTSDTSVCAAGYTLMQSALTAPPNCPDGQTQMKGPDSIFGPGALTCVPNSLVWTYQQLGYSVVQQTGTTTYGAYMCVLDSAVNAYMAAGARVIHNTNTGGGQHGPGGTGGTTPQTTTPGPGNTCGTGYTRVYQVVSGYTSYLCVLNSALSTFTGAGWIVG